MERQSVRGVITANSRDFFPLHRQKKSRPHWLASRFRAALIASITVSSEHSRPSAVKNSITNRKNGPEPAPAFFFVMFRYALSKLTMKSCGRTALPGGRPFSTTNRLSSPEGGRFQDSQTRDPLSNSSPKRSMMGSKKVWITIRFSPFHEPVAANSFHRLISRAAGVAQGVSKLTQ